MNSRMQGFESDVFTAVMNSKRVWLVHVIANAALLAGFFYWTQIPEESALLFGLTAGSGLLIACVTLWLHCATFDYFQPTWEFNFKESLRRSVPRVPAFLLWVVIFGLVLWLIGQVWSYDTQIGGWMRHMQPGPVRRTITPRSAFSATSWLMWFLYFFVWPILLLPVGAQVAVRNFRGFLSRAAIRPFVSLHFWAVYFVCFLIGAYFPYRLAWMIPRTPSSLNAQTWSMVMRLGIGYLLLVTGWLVLCAAIMRASDGEGVRDNEPKPRPLPTPSGASESEV
jgi:hypothetical protein